MTVCNDDDDECRQKEFATSNKLIDEGCTIFNKRLNQMTDRTLVLLPILFLQDAMKHVAHRIALE